MNAQPRLYEAFFFSVWRETRLLPRRRLAAFLVEADAFMFAEGRARLESENDANVDTTVWRAVSDGLEVLHKTYPAFAEAALRDEAEAWIHVPAIRQALRDLADVVDTRGPEVAMATASAGMDQATTTGEVEAYQTALAMISECEEES